MAGGKGAFPDRTGSCSVLDRHAGSMELRGLLLDELVGVNQ